MSDAGARSAASTAQLVLARTTPLRTRPWRAPRSRHLRRCHASADGREDLIPAHCLPVGHIALHRADRTTRASCGGDCISHQVRSSVRYRPALRAHRDTSMALEQDLRTPFPRCRPGCRQQALSPRRRMSVRTVVATPHSAAASLRGALLRDGDQRDDVHNAPAGLPSMACPFQDRSETARKRSRSDQQRVRPEEFKPNNRRFVHQHLPPLFHYDADTQTQ